MLVSDTTHPAALALPLYGLYYIDDVHAAEILDEKSLAQMLKEYDDSEIQAIKDALKWGTEHREYDFSFVLPNLKHSNDDIYCYIVKALERMKSIE